MSINSYQTLRGPTEGLYKEKGSKFISFAYAVSSEVDIKARIEFLKKEYFDARHHCYAWMLGPEKQKFRAFDDGEPNHSAGDPILGQIRSRGITNVLVVVIRYFGGVKLGVGGLISAYKLAAEDALAKASVIEVQIAEVVELVFDYRITSDVMRLIKDLDLLIVHQQFDQASTLKISLPRKHKETFVEKISLMKATGGNVVWQFVSDI